MPQTKVPGNIWEDFGFLDKCEKRRAKHKKKIGRVTYDCEYAQVVGMRVVCKNKRILDRLSSDGSMYLIAVLKGRTSYACRNCILYKE